MSAAASPSAPGPRVRPTTGYAVSEGLSRVGASPRLVLVAWLVSLAVAAPLATVMHSLLADAIGHSEAGQRLVEGWDGLWYRSFEARAQGLGKTFGPGIVGIGAVLSGLDRLTTGTLSTIAGPVLGAGLVYALAWVFIAGGVLGTYLRGPDGAGLWREGARHFPRLLALGLFALVGYGLVLGMVLPALGRWVEAATIDVIDERVAFGWTLGKYAVVWGLLWLVSLVHDYAKVFTVMRPELGALAALREGLRFVMARPRVVFGVSATVVALFGVATLAYWVIAPGAGDDNAFRILVGFGIAQGFVALRIGVRCLGYASRVALVGAALPGEAAGASAAGAAAAED